MPGWKFLSNHGRVLVCIASDPEMRLREVAELLSITERRAYGIVSDLEAAGYVVKERVGRRNRYQIRTELPFPEAAGDQSLGQVLDVLALGGR